MLPGEEMMRIFGFKQMFYTRLCFFCICTAASCINHAIIIVFFFFGGGLFHPKIAFEFWIMTQKIGG